VEEQGMEQIRTSSDFSVLPDKAIVLLRSMPLLQYLPEDKLKNISEALQPLQFGPGEPIVRRNCEGAASLYIIWDGEAKVISPPQRSGSILGHKESFLRCGDYFGIRGPSSLIYKVDIVAVNKVLCLVVPKENINVLRAASVWDWDLQDERSSTIEKILTLHTVESVGDLKLEGPGFPNYYAPYLNGTKSRLPQIRGTNNWFGGQLVAQALLAATKSVDPEQLVHSLHSYFLKTADIHFSVVFNVERIRDGRSYATRHVRAMQNGNLVFFLLASFKVLFLRLVVLISFVIFNI
jgi:acyl-coenzyme A thioesterase 1/2/4